MSIWSEEGLLDPAALGISRLPEHVAVIMDGNGRWAQRRGMPRVLGHREGADSVRRVLRAAYRLGVRYLTLYAFSEQNWGRPEDEVTRLMELLLHHLRSEQPELLARGIRLRGMGSLERLPAGILAELRDFEARSAEHAEMTLTLALSYGGREELVHAARGLASQVAAGELAVEAIDEAAFARHLYLPDLPDPDLLIRSSGEQRISNFLLWQIAYAELYITDTLWPDFKEEELVQALRQYGSRQRRFGLTEGQLASSPL